MFIMLKKVLGIAAAVAFTAGVAGATPLPTEFDGGFVASNGKLFKNVLKAAKEGSKLASKLSKCYSKGAQNVSKGKADGVDACINDPKKGALTKYQAAITKIASKSPGLPACNDYALAGNVIATLTKSFNATTYCASPSGAFIDGASSL